MTINNHEKLWMVPSYELLVILKITEATNNPYTRTKQKGG